MPGRGVTQSASGRPLRLPGQSRAREVGRNQRWALKGARLGPTKQVEDGGACR